MSCRAAIVLLCVAFAAAPGQETGFRFAIVGDRTGEVVSGVYESVWRQIGAEKPAFAISVGDTIQGGKNAVADAEWGRIAPVWRRYRVPFYFTPGNHDIWSEASRKIYERRTGRPAWYSFDYGQAHFTVLDNSRSLQLSDAQMAFLEQDLKRNRSRSPKFVFFHQPFWLLPLMLGNTEFPFHALVRKYGVGFVVSGHVHQFSRLERDGIVYMVVGSSGGHLRGHDPDRDFDQGWFFHHVVVRVQGEHVDMTVKEVGPPLGKGRTFLAGQVR